MRNCTGYSNVQGGHNYELLAEYHTLCFLVEAYLGSGKDFAIG